eukprot:TRINITY_DN2510_c0_g1_i3.p1 TRINITY_DN2510_c0_g1~~TRINITY_DN2510_c0_g1_i3.p1  ORF type:complete len:184 (+),score=60.97 TRINITY_DN2510_c0_g1_i3:195-746(+)
MLKRTTFLLKEFQRIGEDLELPEYAQIEFPDADEDTGIVNAKKYKRFIVHVTPDDDSLYTGGTFRIEFDLNAVPEYPNKPPKAKMLTKIWHVNIDAASGAICHSYLKMDECAGGSYTPILGLQGVVLGILQLFFGLKNPDDPLNVEAANQYKTDFEGYQKKAKEWTKLYAKPVPIPAHCLAQK